MYQYQFQNMFERIEYNDKQLENLEKETFLSKLKYTAPEVSFEIIQLMCESIKNKYLKFIRVEYDQWWEQVCKYKDYDVIASNLYDKYHMIFKEDNSIKSGISIAFDEEFFNEGFFKGELYVISAPSGTGKTAMSIMLATVLALGENPLSNKQVDEKKVLYISLEQKKSQIVSRIKSTLLSLNNIKNSVGYTDILNSSIGYKNEILGNQLYKIVEDRIIILDSSFFESLEIDEILSCIYENYNDNDIVILDQYENINGAHNSTSDYVARKLKAYCVNENKVLIVQSQLSKNAIEKAELKNGGYDIQKFNGSSLRGTSGLEHQAAGIFFLAPTNATLPIGNFTAKKVHLCIAKNRYGESGKIIKMWQIGASNLLIDIKNEDGEITNVQI